MNKIVIIEVRGGVAHILHKDEGVGVVIRDYDNEGVGEEHSEEVYPAKEKEGKMPVKSIQVVFEKLVDLLEAEGGKTRREYTNGSEGVMVLMPTGELIEVHLNNTPDEELIDELFNEDE